MRSYRVRTVDQKVESLNIFLTELRKYVDPDTGIKVFSMNRFARGIYRNYGEMDWAVKTLKKLGLLENIGSAGKAGGTWRVDISDRVVAAEDLYDFSGSNSIPQDVLIRRLRSEYARVERLERELANRDTRISDLEVELTNLRETIQDELLASLVIFLEEQKGSQ